MRAKLVLFCVSGVALFACEPVKVGTADPSEEGGGTVDPGEGEGEGEETDDPYADALAPVAVISGATEAGPSESLTLDGSGSYDPQGFALTDFAWSCSDGSVSDGDVATFSFADVGLVTCTLTVTSESGLTGTASSDLSILRPVANWTVMVFMNGDNELESAGLEDVNEMEMAGSTDAVNLVVQLDRSTGYDRSDDNWTGARRYRVEQDDDMSSIGSTVVEDLGGSDSGRPSTVVDFVAWAAENYPAERYALVLWDHGWSWSAVPSDKPAITKGISSDYTSGNDISVAEGELEDLMEGAVAAIGQPLSIMGFDACTMAGWEIAYATMPYAEVFVGSQDYESEDGWSYDQTFGDLIADPDMSPAELAESIALRFNETKDSTQSAFDLTRLPELNDALDTLAGSMMDMEDPAALLSDASRASLDFEGGRGTDRDLGGLLDNLAEGSADATVAADAATARAVLDEIILSNYTYGRTAASATGMSIYAPVRGSIDSLYLEGSWSEGTLWDDLLVKTNGSR